MSPPEPRCLASDWLPRPRAPRLGSLTPCMAAMVSVAAAGRGCWYCYCRARRRKRGFHRRAPLLVAAAVGRDSTESNGIPPPSRLRRSRKPVRRRRVRSPAAHLRAKIRPPLESLAWAHPSSEGEISSSISSYLFFM